MLSSIIVIVTGTFLALPLSSTHAVIGGMLGVGSAIHGVGTVNWHFVREMLLAWFTSPAFGFLLTVITRFAILIAGKSPLLYTLVVPLVAGISATLAFAVPAVIGPTSVKAVLAPTPWLLTLEMMTVFTVVATITLVYCRQRVISGVDFVSTENVPLGGVDVNSTYVSSIIDENTRQGVSYVSDLKNDSCRSLHMSKPMSMSTSVPTTQLGTAGSEITAPQTVVNLEPLQHRERKNDDNDSNSFTKYTAGDNEQQPNTNLPLSPPRYGSMVPPTIFIMDENAPIFRALLICAVPAIAFAHGSNDVSNGVGPFYGIISYYMSSRTKDLEVDESDLSSSFILKIVVLVGGMAIALGIILFGGHVIATIGRGGISRVPWTFAQAFAAQSSAAAAIIAASGLGIPVGTSHCIVGAVMGCAVKLPGTRSHRQTAVGGNGEEGMRQREGEGESEEQERGESSRVGSDGSFFNWPMLRNIGIGAVATPILSGSIAAVAVLSAKTFLK